MSNLPRIIDPMKLAGLLWPALIFYDKQREVIYSVRDNDETFVPAGNMLGKDFVAGFIILWFFLVHREVRIVTTSVKDDHLRVLWGEIGRFIQTSKYPLTVDKGGPLIYNHRDLRKVVGGKECKISYCRGMVSDRGEGMAGHHAANTLFVGDEASGLDDITIDQAKTWARRVLLIGNCNDCNNSFRKGVKAGDLLAA